MRPAAILTGSGTVAGNPPASASVAANTNTFCIGTFVIAYRHSTEDRDASDVGIGAVDWYRCRCRRRLAAGAAAIVAGGRGTAEAIPVSRDSRSARRRPARSAASTVAAPRRRAVDMVDARAARHQSQRGDEGTLAPVE